MAVIPTEAMPYFENQIYLPMILTILERDRTYIENGPFKLPAPYLRMIDGAIAQVERELKETNDYMRLHKAKVIRGKTEGYFTTFKFIYGNYSDERRYLNVRLRNRTEELIDVFLG